MRYLVFITSMYPASESPWWYSYKERYDDAKRSLLSLTSPKSDPSLDADETVGMMQLNESSTPKRRCFWSNMVFLRQQQRCSLNKRLVKTGEAR